MIYETKSPEETQDLAETIIKKFPPYGQKKALVIALEGELGAGKTTFVQGFAGLLGIKSKIKSPTFTLMKSYKIPVSGNYEFLYHIDCYRLKNYKDLVPLGIKDILDNPKNIVLIEWAERVKEILPGKFIKIHIDHIDQTIRKITIF